MLLNRPVQIDIADGKGGGGGSGEQVYPWCPLHHAIPRLVAVVFETQHSLKTEPSLKVETISSPHPQYQQDCLHAADGDGKGGDGKGARSGGCVRGSSGGCIRWEDSSAVSDRALSFGPGSAF